MAWELVWFCPCCDTDGGEIIENKKTANKLKAEREAKGQKVEVFKTDIYGNRLDPKSYGLWLNEKYTAIGV